jgi:hypothetical protein
MSTTLKYAWSQMDGYGDFAKHRAMLEMQVQKRSSGDHRSIPLAVDWPPPSKLDPYHMPNNDVRVLVLH